MKILYLSCHSILEHDELLILKELGYDFFSMGSYLNPQSPQDPKRPAIDHHVDDHLIQIAIRYSKDMLPDVILKEFDTVIVMHIPEWIGNNWERMGKKKVIWRSIGQSTQDLEKWLKTYKDKGLKIVRYSSKEDAIPNYAGHDAIIKFYKDENEFNGWVGETKQVITIAQSMKDRGRWCGFDWFNQITSPFPRQLFGPHNENSGIPGGLLSYDELKNQLRGSRVYFYTGTYPACYTLNFIEAWMTGIPVVALGNELGNPQIFGEWNTYQIHGLIDNEVNGFYSNDIDYLRAKIQMLFDDWDYARKIGEEGRKKAIKIFGKQQAKDAWGKFLQSL